jgi:antitoxin MazE
MKLELVRVGNSRGIRIPKSLIEQCGFGRTVSVRVKDNCLVISPERRPREGWERTFQTAGTGPREPLLLGNMTNKFDQEEWQW